MHPSPAQLVSLQLLGSTELRTADAAATGVLAQPKRLALLARLALAGPGAFVRRDALLAMFWPESNTERARNSLRQVVYVLRRELGEDGVCIRGSEEVGLSAGRVACDVWEFERALEEGDPVRAMQHYRGELLEGFHLGGAPEWEEWLERERARLRYRAAASAWSLAEAAEAEGDGAGAADWGRRAADLTPGDEAPLRRLLELLARLGDRAAAVRAYEDFARRLGQEWEMEPSDRTRRLAAEIRARRDEGAVPPSEAALPPVPTPVAAPRTVPLLPGGRGREEGQSAHAGAVADPVAPAITPRPSTCRYLVAGAVVVLVLLAVAGGALWRATRDGSTARRVGTARVAVLPFVVRGTSEWAYLSDGMADLLSAKLDGAGTLRSVDLQTLLGSLEVQGGVVDPRQGRKHAQRLEADLYVLGSVVATGERLQLRAALYDADRSGNAEPAAAVTVEGAADELPRLVDALTSRLLADRLRAPDQRLDRTAALTTPSLPALKAYLQGMGAFRAGFFEPAVASLSRAVQADSGFALAWYRLAVAQHWAATPAPVWRESARQALLRADRLSPQNRLLLQGLHASGAQRYGEAERAYRQAVLERPDDVEGWEQLAETLYHAGPQRGQPAANARSAWERTLALNPDHVSALIHLARLAAHRGDRSAVDTLSRRALALNPSGDRALEILGLRGVVLGDADALRESVARLRREDDERVMTVALRVAESSENPAGARPLAALLTEPLRPARTRAVGHALLARLEAARGRWSAARAELERAARHHPTVAQNARVELTVLPFLPVSAAELRETAAARGARRRVTYLWLGEAPLDTVGPPELALHEQGLLAARGGDAAGALAIAARLEAMPSAPLRAAPTAASGRPWGMPPAALAAGVRAHVAWMGGPVADPLGDAQRAWVHPANPGETIPFVFFTAHPRFLRAELLRRGGREREALGWYASVWEDLDFSSAYAAPAHLARAEILDGQGRRAEAAAHFRRFVTLWRDADPALQPQVRRARARLAQLEG
ncbi:MAG: hypothetical protein KY464_02125 [Gemmatimonadetes bacterium]|nr:hypothetical protein [Gemmatimonadota bacterium]